MHALMYCTGYCPFCLLAERLLRSKGLQIEKIHVDHKPRYRTEMERLSGSHLVPQIFIGERHIGSYDELVRLDENGHLDRLIAH